MKRLYARKETDLDPHIFLRYETVVREWWSSLPDELRPCKDPFLFQSNDVDTLPKGSFRTLPFVMVHVMTMMLHSVLLKPRESTSGGSRGDFLGVLRQHALSMAMRSCGILLHLFRYVDLFRDNGDSCELCWKLLFVLLYHIIYMAFPPLSVIHVPWTNHLHFVLHQIMLRSTAHAAIGRRFRKAFRAIRCMCSSRPQHPIRHVTYHHCYFHKHGIAHVGYI